MTAWRRTHAWLRSERARTHRSGRANLQRLAASLGVSPRTLLRWASNTATPTESQQARLAAVSRGAVPVAGWGKRAGRRMAIKEAA